MDNQSTIDHLITHTKQYEFSDGLREIQLAVLWLGTGLTTWFILERPDIWLAAVYQLKANLGDWARWLAMLLVLIPSVLVILCQIVIRYTRQRWLWRQSGWVKPNPSAIVPQSTYVVAAAIVVLSALFGAALYQLDLLAGDAALRLLVVGTGWANGFIMVSLSKSIGLQRYAWFGFLGGVLLTPLLFLPLSFGLMWLLFGVWWGLILALSGAMSLRRTLSAIRK